MDDSVSCVIPGASNLSQVVINSAAADLPALSEEQMDKVKEIYEKHIHKYAENLW
jgi:aryl-alcohol dehydrogenase-like predicted oxidoreductase